jgi:hypothetical protein
MPKGASTGAPVASSGRTTELLLTNACSAETVKPA